MKKKRINIGLRGNTNLVNEKELEDSIKAEIKKEINSSRYK